MLALKQQAGADFAITQLFFNIADYVNLVERAQQHGVDMPIIPGIMPVTNVAQIQRFAQLSGAAFPIELERKFLAVADDPIAVHQVGVTAATELSQQLLAHGAPGLHFYTLNRSTSTREVYANLGLNAKSS